MSHPFICDECKQQIVSPEHWTLEQDGDHVFGRLSGPFDFCRLACLAAWSRKKADAQRASHQYAVGE